MKILTVILTYEESDVIPPYLMNNLNGWLIQDIDADIDIVISDNLSGLGFDREMRKFCENNSNAMKRFHYVTNKNHEPGCVSMNLGFRFMKDTEYDVYIYNSDDTVMSRKDDLGKILSTFVEHNDAGIVSARVNSDNALILYPHNLKRGDGSALKINVGESVNLHMMCFSRYFMKKYNFKYPDIITSYGNESILSFLVKAIKKEWYLCRSVKLKNNKILKRFPKSIRKMGRKYKPIGIVGYGIYKNFKTFDEIFKEGTKVGMGFECWRRIAKKPKEKRDPHPYWYLPDPDCYDENGKCKYPEQLYQYIKNNIYLPNTVANYDKMLTEMLATGI